jgi:GTP-binding protein Era
VEIHATIYVERGSQKGILIGKQGSKLKAIGISARKDIEELLDRKVMLKLWVKVRKHWQRDGQFLRELGF